MARTASVLQLVAIVAIAPLVGTLPVACGSSGDPAADPAEAGTSDAPSVTEGLTVAEFCAQKAKRWCAAVAKCEPNTTADLFDGKIERCEEGSRTTCEALLAGSASTPIERQACIAAFDVSTCAKVVATYSGVGPRECALKGTLPNGSPCLDATQCASGTCGVPPGLRCGTCVDPSPIGAPCDATSCAAPAVCAMEPYTSSGTCAVHRSEGEACGASVPCHPLLRCDGGKCAARLSAGASCAADASACERGLFCNTIGKICQAVGTAGVGEKCGLVASGGLTYCGAGAVCRVDQGQAYLGTCVTELPDGLICNGGSYMLDGPCTFPSRCTRGTCVRPAPSACKDPLVPRKAPTTCSADSTSTTKVTWHNLSNTRDLAISWVTTGCVEVAYFVLNAGGISTQSTYSGHVWRLRDAYTGELVQETIATTSPLDVNIP